MTTIGTDSAYCSRRCNCVLHLDDAERSRVYQAKGDLDRALADYDKAIAIRPGDADAYLRRGVANLYAGALPKALAYFNQALVRGTGRSPR